MAPLGLRALAASVIAFNLLLLTDVAPASGAEPAAAEVYRRYCASCHGLAGKGDGPVASELRTAPSDLTTIRRRNGGRFNLKEVMSAIDGRRAIHAHGSREMPVWGAVFHDELQEKPYAELTTLLKAKTLAEYIESLQMP